MATVWATQMGWDAATYMVKEFSPVFARNRGRTSSSSAGFGGRTSADGSLQALKWPAASGWVKATLPALGGPGIFLCGFLDSSFVPLPLVTDLIVMELSIRQPLRMPYYVAMAALGSLAGSIWIYALARKAGEAYYRKKQGHEPGRIRKWVEQYPFTSVGCPPWRLFPCLSSRS